MANGPDDLDLSAAWLRRARTDLKAFMEALAHRLEGALPGFVQVERRRDGLFSRSSRVVRIALQTGAEAYVLQADRGAVIASRDRLVRGVRLSTTTLPMDEWLSEVRVRIQALAEQQGLAADVLHDFL